MFGDNNKPSAAEQMVAKLLGFTPEQMQQTLVGFRDTIVSVSEQLKRIEETQAVILAKLEGQNNGGHGNGSGGSGAVALVGSDTGDASGSAGGGASGGGS